MRQQTVAYLYAATTILCWSTVASAFKLSLAYLTFDQLLFYACFVSLVILMVLARRRVGWRDLVGWGGREWLRSAVLGFLSPFLYYLMVLKAYALLPAQEAMTLNFVWPVVLVLFSIAVLRQPLRLGTVIAMSVSFLGVVTIATRGDLLGLRISNATGAALAVGSSVVWGLNWVYGTKDRHDPVARLLLNFAFGALYITLYELTLGNLVWPAPAGLAGAVYIGAFEMGITYILWLNALRLSRTTAQVSNLIYLTPFLSLVVVHFAVGERIYPSTLVGLALIIGGIFVQHYARGRLSP